MAPTLQELGLDQLAPEDRLAVAQAILGERGPLGRGRSATDDLLRSSEVIHMAFHIEILDTVALTEDVPAHGLTAGEVGAVVEILGAGEAFEVEFCDNSGATYGLHTLRAGQLIPLHTRGQALRLRVQAA